MKRIGCNFVLVTTMINKIKRMSPLKLMRSINRPVDLYRAEVKIETFKTSKPESAINAVTAGLRP